MQAIHTPILTALNCISIWRRVGQIFKRPIPPADNYDENQLSASQLALEVIKERRKFVEGSLFAVYALSQGLQVVRLKLNHVEDSQVKVFEHGFLQAFCLTILLMRFKP